MWKKFKSFFSRPAGDVRFSDKKKMFGEKEYLIRKAQLEDIREMLAVERNVYDGFVPWTYSAFSLELKSHRPHLYLVVEHEEKVIAFVGCRIKNHEAHITNIAVERPFQSLGIATCLLSEMKKFAQKQKAKQMSLEVRFENKDAQRLYRKFGFSSKKIMKNYYERQEDGLVMIYPLEKNK